MQEQEQKDSEEAEKRLKAALTAKREPSSSVSRLASPAVAGAAEQSPEPVKPSADVKPAVDDSAAISAEDVSMEPIDATTPVQFVDVRVYSACFYF
jgi:THO complex subunit 2